MSFTIFVVQLLLVMELCKALVDGILIRPQIGAMTLGNNDIGYVDFLDVF